MIYQGKNAKRISFPLGGIGTGCIGLTGNGELSDWEIFNRPNKNTRNGYSHFAVKATVGGRSVTRVLHGDTNEDLSGTPCASRGHYGYGFAPRRDSLAGFPHFKDVTFEGVYPLARMTFRDEDFPAVVRLCAFNPYIPHDEFNSSLPAAFFAWEIENVSTETVSFSLAATVANPAKETRNGRVGTDGQTGILFESAGVSPDDVAYTELCVLTDATDAVAQEYWYRGAWQDGCTTYWKNITECDRLPERSYAEAGNDDHGTLASYMTLAPGERAAVRFVISWYVPNAYNYWDDGEAVDRTPWKNYYATQFDGALAVARYAMTGFSSLYEKTRRFTEALMESTLPDTVKDAISANLSIIKTPTALRLSDGSFWGWEGCCETVGSCEGTCQHVWNYAYVMPYLFPRLERSIREMVMKYARLPNGGTAYRIPLPLREQTEIWRACVDGQMGEVFKCYREWRFSGDDEWLKKNADEIFSMLEYAWSPENPDGWDADMDGVLEGRQHHTLDLEMFGPSSWLQGFYLLALDCGAQMAKCVGDERRAALYTRLYESGKRWTDENLFNGKYFYHKIDLTDRALVERFGAAREYWNEESGEIKYQAADGCLIDQMLADWHARLLGVDPVFDKEKKRIALGSVYENNYKPTMRGMANMWRNFTVNDEAGTVICAYPEGARVPAIPISYCEETMAGFEYAFAGLLVSEGYRDEGERVIGAVRDRYDGERRNPWNEIECGSNYARSMASFALLPIYSGFTVDMRWGHIGFAPIEENGQYLFSAGGSYGIVRFAGAQCTLSVLGDPLTLCSVSLPCAESVTRVLVDGEAVDFTRESGRLLLGRVTVVREVVFS